MPKAPKGELGLLATAAETIPPRHRTASVMVATAAIATYVRSLLLYGHGPWADGIVEWLSQTLIGYFGLVLLSVPIIVFESWKTRFFGFDRERTPGEIVVDVCVALLALCALLWIAHAHHRL